MSATNPKKHIQASGAKMGQWVTCSAENCTLGGRHITHEQLLATRINLQQKTGKRIPLSKITENDASDYVDLADFNTPYKKEERKIERERLLTEIPENIKNIPELKKFLEAGPVSFTAAQNVMKTKNVTPGMVNKVNVAHGLAMVEKIEETKAEIAYTMHQTKELRANREKRLTAEAEKNANKVSFKDFSKNILK